MSVPGSIHPTGRPRPRTIALAIGGAVVIAAGAGAVLTVSGQVSKSPLMGDVAAPTQPVTCPATTQVQPVAATQLAKPGEAVAAPIVEYKPAATATQVQPGTGAAIPLPGGPPAANVEYQPAATATQPETKPAATKPAINLTPAAATERVFEGELTASPKIEWKPAAPESPAPANSGQGEAKP